MPEEDDQVENWMRESINAAEQQGHKLLSHNYTPEDQNKVSNFIKDLKNVYMNGTKLQQTDFMNKVRNDANEEHGFLPTLINGPLRLLGIIGPHNTVNGLLNGENSISQFNDPVKYAELQIAKHTVARMDQFTKKVTKIKDNMEDSLLAANYKSLQNYKRNE